tara:strand:- start:1604 stop:1849 length:246 start_codon:yes stop_codon:yes gene_type:complete
MAYLRDKETGANQLLLNIQLRNDDKWHVQLFESFIEAEIDTKPYLMDGKVKLHSSGPYSTYDKAAAVAREAIIAAGVDSLC